MATPHKFTFVKSHVNQLK